ncbi:MAG: SAM-dependent methyltransferase [Rubrivivax sp.]
MRDDGSPSLAPEYFDAVYAASADPWHFQTSVYERAKYQRTLAALPRARFERGVEIGCSIGVLTRQLALRCGHLLALDVNESAVQKAGSDLAASASGSASAGRPGSVEFLQMQVPQAVPPGKFDLIVVSEVGYYWSAADLHRSAEWMVGALNEGGAVVLVHWTDPVADYPLTGDRVHAHFIDLALQGRLRRRYGEWHPRYRIDVFERAGTAPPLDEAP